jgi:hypothetical protein
MCGSFTSGFTTQSFIRIPNSDPSPHPHFAVQHTVTLSSVCLRLLSLQVNPSGGVGAGNKLLYEYGQGSRPLDFVLRYDFCPRCMPDCWWAVCSEHDCMGACLTEQLAAGAAAMPVPHHRLLQVESGSKRAGQGATDY